jgi:hypothetical protein
MAKSSNSNLNNEEEDEYHSYSRNMKNLYKNDTECMNMLGLDVKKVNWQIVNKNSERSKGIADSVPVERISLSKISQKSKKSERALSTQLPSKIQVEGKFNDETLDAFLSDSLMRL